jgi:hypothetical protein
MAIIETALSILTLAGFIWVFLFLLPKARRDHDRFAIVCSLLTALVAIFAWLFIGIAAHSR